MSETAEVTAPAIDLDAARKLCAKATPGPWIHTPGVAIKEYVASDNGDFYISMQQVHWDDGRATNAENNAPFIAAARTLLPQALDEIERLRDQVTHLQKAYRLRANYRPERYQDVAR